MVKNGKLVQNGHKKYQNTAKIASVDLVKKGQKMFKSPKVARNDQNGKHGLEKITENVDFTRFRNSDQLSARKQ